ncbi:MAG: hypothetical protein NVSMB17_14520 [Candidatus Dormibacteria bacterium]
MLCAVAVLTLGLQPVAPARAAAPATWLAGAAAVKITPPAYNPAHDARDFPLCDTSFFSGRRLFDFQEPYVDTAGTGFFQYGDLFCDANHNGRYDGLYSSGGVDHLLEWVHDDIWARALAVSDGTHTVVIETITAQGLLLEDPLRVRAAIKADRPGVTQVYVSSTHNESSPDPIGIYGAPDNGTGSAGVFSGVDDYYSDFLVKQATSAADQAVDALAPARMRVSEIYLPDVAARLSQTFLTTDAIRSPPAGQPRFGTPEATNRRGHVLQLVRAGDGGNIETLFGWAAHNQQVGHADDRSLAPDPADANKLKRINRSVSDDWPGYFARDLEASLGGHAMFLVGDNGSIEDPHPVPAVAKDCPAADFSDHVAREEGCFDLPTHTGALVAGDVLAAISSGLEEVAPHQLKPMVDQFLVPLQNQLFIAAFAAGLFAHRTIATVQPCLDANNMPRTCFLTEVGLVDFGPQLQLLVNPAESYPAEIQGHPFGIEEMACPGRPQPPVPNWHAGATHKIQAGLGDDLIGYMIPAPGWFSDPAVYADPGCPMGAQAQANPTADYDQHNQYHKLESESVGPDAGNLLAQHLAALADTASSGGPRQVQAGRFLTTAGTFTRKGRESPVGAWVLPAGVTAFAPGTGTIVALPGVNSFGGLPVNAHGVFMDLDGRPQAAPDIDTRGMLVTGVDGVRTRYYVDVYPQLTGAAPGPASAAAGTSPGGGTPGNPPAVVPAGTGLPLTGTGGDRAVWWLPALLLLFFRLRVAARRRGTRSCLPDN